MKTVIIFRFSAMGDVAITMATLATVLKHNPNLKVIFVTRSRFAPFFANYPQIEVFPCDFTNEFKGFPGLYKLFSRLKKYKPDYILDLHQNLRTNVLKTLFFLSGKKSFSLDKQRKAKKEIISKKRKTPLKHVSEQYLDVFKNAKLVESTLTVENLTPIFKTTETVKQKITDWLSKQPKSSFIGIAPFAQHSGKIWPLEKYNSLLKKMAVAIPHHKILLFGGGKKEEELIANLVAENSNATSVVHAFSLEEELELISRMSYFISGDSSNMHFATLMGVPVISIWGATHTSTGFGPLFQPQESIVEIPQETLECRPCSVYGKKPCSRGDYACLNWIEPETVCKKIVVKNQ